ncbi:MAG: Gfo/Idh/MocA family protein [Opitutaceae bacterium]
MNRRAFLKRAAAAAPAIAGFPQIVAASTLGLSGGVAPSNRIRLGFIGLGRHGLAVNLKMCLGLPECSVAALCDVDTRQIEAARNLMADASLALGGKDRTQDWREVIVRPDVDAVVISTPNQWHVPMSIAAARAGKDVMCEKTSHTIAEGREMVEVMDRCGTVFQMAMEDRSLPEYRRMAEVVRNGGIGKLERIEMTIPKGPHVQLPLREEPVPPELDWNMWLGPAPEAPYQKERVMADYARQLGWRHIRDYGDGVHTDWAVHMGDTALWAMGEWEHLEFTVEAAAGYLEPGVFDMPQTYDIEYGFESGVTMSVKTGGEALRFIGSDGWIGNAGWRKPVEASRQEILNLVYGAGDIRLEVYEREQQDFLAAIRTRGPTMYSPEYYHRISTFLIAGNIAAEVGRKLRWTPREEAFIDDAAANALRSRPARTDWAS